jgi:hypothetical protein
MTPDEAILGRCPDCDEPIPETWLILEYEKEDGTVGKWAECPECRDVVAPR